MITRKAPIALVTTAISEMSKTSIERCGRCTALPSLGRCVDSVDEILQTIIGGAIERALLFPLHDVLQKNENCAEQQRQNGRVEGHRQPGGDLVEGDVLGVLHASSAIEMPITVPTKPVVGITQTRNR